MIHNSDHMSAVSLQKTYIDKKGGVVVLSLEEYARLQERAVPTFYLQGKEALSLDRAVVRALRDYQGGKTRKIHTLADLS